MPRRGNAHPFEHRSHICPALEHFLVIHSFLQLPAHVFKHQLRASRLVQGLRTRLQATHLVFVFDKLGNTLAVSGVLSQGRILLRLDPGTYQTLLLVNAFEFAHGVARASDR